MILLLAVDLQFPSTHIFSLPDICLERFLGFWMQPQAFQRELTEGFMQRAPLACLRLLHFLCLLYGCGEFISIMSDISKPMVQELWLFKTYRFFKMVLIFRVLDFFHLHSGPAWYFRRISPCNIQFSFTCAAIRRNVATLWNSMQRNGQCVAVALSVEEPFLTFSLLITLVL